MVLREETVGRLLYLSSWSSGEKDDAFSSAKTEQLLVRVGIIYLGGAFVRLTIFLSSNQCIRPRSSQH